MKIRYKEPAKTVIISEEELTKALIAWAKGAFHTVAIAAGIVHDDDYPNSIFVELSADQPLEEDVFAGLFRKYDTSGTFHAEDELTDYGRYSLLPEVVSVGIIRDNLQEITGIAADELAFCMESGEASIIAIEFGSYSNKEVRPNVG